MDLLWIVLACLGSVGVGAALTILTLRDAWAWCPDCARLVAPNQYCPRCYKKV